MSLLHLDQLYLNLDKWYLLSSAFRSLFKFVILYNLNSYISDKNDKFKLKN